MVQRNFGEEYRPSPSRREKQIHQQKLIGDFDAWRECLTASLLNQGETLTSPTPARGWLGAC